MATMTADPVVNVPVMTGGLAPPSYAISTLSASLTSIRRTP